MLKPIAKIISTGILQNCFHPMLVYEDDKILCLLRENEPVGGQAVETNLPRTALRELLSELKHTLFSSSLGPTVNTLLTLPSTVVTSAPTVLNFSPWRASMRSANKSDRSSQQIETVSLDPFWLDSIVTSSASVGSLKDLSISQAFLLSSFTCSMTAPSREALSSYIIIRYYH